MGRPPKIQLDPARAVEYLRVSTDEQNLGTDAQHAAIALFAEKRRLTIVASHTDHGLSGSLPLEQRPGLSAAVSALSEHRAGVLLIAKRDRLARDILVAASTTRIVEQLGARIESADGMNENSAEGDLLRGVVDLMAQHERALIRRRTTDALAVKKRRGEKLGGAPPFGTRAERKSPDGPLVLVPDEQEQAVIERILQLAGAGAAPSAIANQLNADKVPARGARWHTNTIVRLLARKRPAGAPESA